MRLLILLLAVLAAGLLPITAMANPEFQKKWEPTIEPPAAGRGAKPDKWKIEEEEKKKSQKPVYCKDKRDFVPDIDVILTAPEPTFVFTKTKKDIGKINDDGTLNKLTDAREKQAWIEKSSLAGLSRSSSGFNTRSRLVGKPYGGLAALYCPFFKKVEIEVFYATTIYVASEYRPGSCMYDYVVRSGMRYHNDNLKIVTEHAIRLESDLPAMMAQIENYGYVGHDKIDHRFNLMSESIGDAVDIYGNVAVEKIREERIARRFLEKELDQEEVKKCRGKP